ncbi:MAG TPA: arsinothricin resistance N-acetyltransferase ArsN1 family B [Gemmatimonadaceae bacterium]|nr:arsinothricin resistance N-acetyltransferase ArsN1 family B [Gemmatimonadaceae bacterium]
MTSHVLHTPTTLTIRPVQQGDAGEIARIYNVYVEQTTISFEEEVVSIEEMSRRIDEVLDAKLPFLVAEQDGNIVGYAHASKWKGRCAYRFSVELSVYIDKPHSGTGIGSKLYDELFRLLRELGVHALIAGISLPNEASVALHEKLGMTKVAEFKQIGFKFERWIDVGYWQVTLG